MTAPPKRRCAMVTGASYGVGEATAHAFAEEGYDLVLTATKASNLERTCAALAGNVRVLPLVLDLCSQASIDEAVAASIAQFGTIDVLVNNAGTTLRKWAVDVTREEWDFVMGPNVTGTFFLTQAVGRHMIERRIAGSIVSIASSHAFIGANERSTYGISKAAVVQMTRMLAIEWAPHKIRVNAVAPGRLETASPARLESGADPKYMAAMLSKIPLGRFATVDEVAAAAAYLASPKAAAVTGQTITVDGGLTSA